MQNASCARPYLQLQYIHRIRLSKRIKIGYLSYLPVTVETCKIKQKYFKSISYFHLPHRMKNIEVSSFQHDVDHNKVFLLCESILSLLRALYRRSNGNSLDATVYLVQLLKQKHKYRLHLCCPYTKKSKRFGLSLQHITQNLHQH